MKEIYIDKERQEILLTDTNNPKLQKEYVREEVFELLEGTTKEGLDTARFILANCNDKGTTTQIMR